MDDFDNRFQDTGLIVHPKEDRSLREIQTRLEKDEGPFYLNSHEVRSKNLDEPLKIYRPI
jgi:hypothetical protein